MNPSGSLRLARVLCLAATFPLALTAAAQSSSATEYHLSFPDAVHHVMQVEVTFHKVPPRSLRIQMSRSSPGRYAAFEFASNVFEERFTDGDGKPLPVTRPDPRTWSVTSHDGTVHVAYKLFGDRVNGTFVAVDLTHAHINFPAALMWAQGFDDRPVRVTFALPEGSGWKIATQLYPTSDSQAFTAPNLPYLMDSPTELSHFVQRSFQVPGLKPGSKTQAIRVVAHSQATDAELDTYFAGVQKLVREEQAVFGELPDYEPGSYTFLADAFPWDGGDGMEHRNSTVVTGRKLSLETAAHEFFHCWNVRRIRPEGLEPFNFRDVNMSGEMFLAEGFTQYYGNLSMLRSGLTPATDLEAFAGDLSYVLIARGSSYRSAMDMSRLAPLVDGSSDDFPKYWSNDFVSYYSYGDVIALGLDLTLRVRSQSRITLDDFMRAMWRAYGKPGGPAPGLVGKPYNIADVQTQLAAVSRDPAFAAEFVRKYIAGTDKVDYAPLLLHAGYVLRKKAGPASLGHLRLTKGDDAVRVSGSTAIGSPAYKAGVDLDDEILSVAGTPLTAPEDLTKALAGHKAGETVEIVFRRRGQEVHAVATLADPQDLELVTIESTGVALSAEQKQFREAWLGSKAK
jgi:predicted metalloprotease with PDZ domain